MLQGGENVVKSLSVGVKGVCMRVCKLVNGSELERREEKKRLGKAKQLLLNKVCLI